MNKEDKIIKDFYKNIAVEDERLTKDKTHQIEFITTTTYIDKYLKKGDKILEVGAATGAYSLHYARQGYEVEQELNKETITIEDYIATDGPGRLIADTINNMDDENYKHYINYHLSVCNRKDLIGYSGHILAIAKKK